MLNKHFAVNLAELICVYVLLIPLRFGTHCFWLLAGSFVKVGGAKLLATIAQVEVWTDLIE